MNFGALACGPRVFHQCSTVRTIRLTHSNIHVHRLLAQYITYNSKRDLTQIRQQQ
jgi:hypothetical protein